MLADVGDLLFDIEPQIKRNLIIPASRGVELCASFTDSFRQCALDIHVHVFERFVTFEISGADFLLDFAQPSLNLLLFGSGKNSSFRQCCRVDDRAGDVMPVKAMIERNRLAVVARDACGWLLESSLSHLTSGTLRTLSRAKSNR